MAFQTVDPAAAYLHSWHIDCISEYLEAATRREIKKLIINIPPRMLKSIITNVAWPAWLLGQNPSEKIISASYSQKLSLKHSVNCRHVMRSQWYADLFPETVIADDENTKEKFGTTMRGYRFATSVDGTSTGDGGNFLLIDDPVNPKEAESATARDAANEWYDLTFSTRKDDKINGVEVLIMQRLHQNDLTGHWLEHGDCTHVKLPAIAPERTIISIGDFYKVREAGDILQPEREDRAALDKQLGIMGAYGFAGQYEQEPAPRQGGMFDTTKIAAVPVPPSTTQRVRKWDLASVSGGGDYTVGGLLAKVGDRYTIEDIIRFQGASHEVERAIVNTASQDGTEVIIHLTQDPGQAGKAQAAYLVSKLAGYTVLVETETGDKATRATPFSSQVNVGNVDMVKAPWNKKLLEELQLFPNATHDDQVDSLAGAFNILSKGSVGGNILAYMERKLAERENKAPH